MIIRHTFINSNGLMIVDEASYFYFDIYRVSTNECVIIIQFSHNYGGNNYGQIIENEKFSIID